MYSDRARKHFLNPRNVGPLRGATHQGSAGKPGLGNYMVIQLKVEADRISAAAFQTYGCAGAIACGCELTDMVLDKSVREALGIQPEDIIHALGGLPAGKEHCARLALDALREALADEAD